MISTAPLGISIPSLSDIKREVRKAVADEAAGIAKTTLDKLKPEIPGIVKTATQAAVDKLEPQIPRRVEAAIGAARTKLTIPKSMRTKAIAAAAVVGTLWVSSAVFSFLAWRKK